MYMFLHIHIYSFLYIHISTEGLRNTGCNMYGMQQFVFPQYYVSDMMGFSGCLWPKNCEPLTFCIVDKLNRMLSAGFYWMWFVSWGAEKHHTLRVEGQQFLNLILLTLCTYSTALVLMRPAALAIHTQQQYMLARRGRAEWHLQMSPLVKLWSNLHFFPWTVDTVFHELTFHVLIYSLSCIVISTLDPNCSRLPDVSTKMLL